MMKVALAVVLSVSDHRGLAEGQNTLISLSAGVQHNSSLSNAELEKSQSRTAWQSDIVDKRKKPTLSEMKVQELGGTFLNGTHLYLKS